MALLRAACVQMRSGTEPAANVAAASGLVRQAAADGATYVQTPEMTNLLMRDRGALLAMLSEEAADPSLAAFRQLAAELAIHLHVGSLAVRAEVERGANRSFLIGPDGGILARYDKIHMFDVDLGGGEVYTESRTYRPGEAALAVDTDFGRVGMSVCYDLRFPQLYFALAEAGAAILAVPSAFTRPTGQAHWKTLLRARAIETGAFVVAAAQGGRHESGRETYGHSLIVGPWGEVLAEAGHDEPCVIHADLDLDAVAEARRRIPALANRRPFSVRVVERLAANA